MEFSDDELGYLEDSLIFFEAWLRESGFKNTKKHKGVKELLKRFENYYKEKELKKGYLA